MSTEPQILHVCADRGVEDEVLSGYGDVTRVSIDPHKNPYSDVVQGDVRHMPVSGGWDLGVFQPPCTKWSSMVHISGDPDDHPNLIPDCRRSGKELCDEYIIENVPASPLNRPVNLNGQQFGMPFPWKRSFEVSYDVPPAPPIQSRFGETPESKSFADNDGWPGTKREWKTFKGYSHDWNARALKRTAVPRPMVDYLMRPLVRGWERGD